MAEAVEALLGELVLALGVARIHAGLAHDLDELLSVAGTATGPNKGSGRYRRDADTKN
jgi:hypothetical protein